MRVVIADTPRLLIRELSINDAEFVLALTNEPSTIENIGDKGLRSVADAGRFIREGPWISQQKPGHGQFAMELKKSGALVGVCGLLYRPDLGLTDVGFALFPTYWRQGLAFEAAQAVMSYGYSVLGVENIVGLTSETNTASIRLLEKLGMGFEKMVSMSDDGHETTCLYSRKETVSTTG